MNELVGQKLALKYLDNELKSDQLSHAYMLYGPKNIGKTSIALAFSLGVICEKHIFGGCQECRSCKLVSAGNHPDYCVFDGTENMGVEEIREIIKSLELKAHQSSNRVFIVTNIERLSASASNSFLKSLEEPGSGNLIILTANNIDSVLDTIKSRTRMIRLDLAKRKDIFEHLNKTMLVKRDLAEKISRYTGGRAGLAIHFGKNLEVFEAELLLATKMWQIYKGSSIYDKISFADRLIKEDSVVSALEFGQVFAESGLWQAVESNKDSDCVCFSSYINSLATAIDLLSKNINKKIVIDNLMLGNLNG